DAAHRSIQAEARIEREGGVGRLRQLRPYRAQLRVLKRDHGLESVCTSGQLDHHEDAVVHHAVELAAVDRARDHVGHRGVSGGETRGAGAEHETVPQEVTTRQPREIGGAHYAYLISAGTPAMRRPRTSAICPRGRG